MVTRVLRLLVFAVGLLLANVTVAAADDGSPCLLSTAGSLRSTSGLAPTYTILRPVAKSAAAQDLILVVGGLGTTPGDDGMRALFAEALSRVPDVTYAYFGDGAPGGMTESATYDTQGPLDVNALILVRTTRQWIALDDISRVDVLAHSMGGVVTMAAIDRYGLGAKDGLVSATLLDSPTRGSTAAALIEDGLRRAGAAQAEAVALGCGISGGIAADSAAVGDLAKRKSPAAPRDVRIVSVCAADSTVVDTKDCGVDGGVNIFTWTGGGLESHGAITSDPQAHAAFAANVAGQPIPRDVLHDFLFWLIGLVLDYPRDLIAGAIVTGLVVIAKVLHDARNPIDALLDIERVMLWLIGVRT